MNTELCRGLRAKTNIIDDASTIDIKELFDKMGIEMADETTQTLTKLSKEWNNLPQEDKDKIINAFCKLPN